jgi:hypothetical protein
MKEVRMPRTFATFAGLAMIVASPAFAQSTGGSPNDPNNARNQFPAPSASAPTDPAAEYDPASRVPTAPQVRAQARDQIGGQTGYRPGYLPPAPATGLPEVVDRLGVPAAVPGPGEPDPIVVVPVYE